MKKSNPLGLKTEGVSPKLIAAVGTPAVVGVVVLVLGVVSGDQSLREIGVGIIVATIPAGIGAHRASPGVVTKDDGV